MSFQAPCSRPTLSLAELRTIAAQFLRRVLADAAAGNLPPGKTIVIEVDGAIGDISFQALVDPSGHYLSERFEFASSPGLLYADRLRERPFRSQEIRLRWWWAIPENAIA